MPDSVELVRRIHAQLLSQGIDTLLMLSREDSDGVLARIIDTHVVAQTAVFFNADGTNIVLTRRTDAPAYGVYPFFTRIITMEDDFSVEFERVFNQLNPRTLALNICESHVEFDGLRWGLHAQLEDIIGPERLGSIEVSSADILREVF